MTSCLFPDCSIIIWQRKTITFLCNEVASAAFHYHSPDHSGWCWTQTRCSPPRSTTAPSTCSGAAASAEWAERAVPGNWHYRRIRRHRCRRRRLPTWRAAGPRRKSTTRTRQTSKRNRAAPSLLFLESTGSSEWTHNFSYTHRWAELVNMPLQKTTVLDGTSTSETWYSENSTYLLPAQLGLSSVNNLGLSHMLGECNHSHDVTI